MFAIVVPGRKKLTYARNTEAYQTKLAIINHLEEQKDMSRTKPKFVPGVEGKRKGNKAEACIS